MDSRNRFTRGLHAVLLGALVLLLAAPAAHAAAVQVDGKVVGTPRLGGLVRAEVAIKINDGSRLRSVTWEQVYGAQARLTPLANNAVRVRLGKEAAYRDALIHALKEAPIEVEEYLSGLQERWQVVAINPHALEEGGLVVLEVKVLTTSGLYTDTVEVGLDLGQPQPGVPAYKPFAVATGLSNVPVNQRVLLYGKAQASYDWTLADKPFASDAALRDAKTRTPSFVPDAPGKYELRVTDTKAKQVVTLTLYAGTWRGVVAGVDVRGDVVADTACTNCHNGNGEEKAFTPAVDKFTPWTQTGHSKVFSDNLNTSDHYGPNCLTCHTVGYDPRRGNSGIDEAPDFGAFLASDLMHGAAPTNWNEMLKRFPEAARMANIQCENCHGPQVTEGDDSPAHSLRGEAVGKPRLSLASELCGTCHGEPTRHARFQQWQVSGHGNYELAIGEGDSGDCSRCHTANGFLAWVPAQTDDDPSNDLAQVKVTWDENSVHPQTCVTCHDPHVVGTTTDKGTDAPMRVADRTGMLPGGYKAVGVGKGAICITCHNSRRGLRNDNVPLAESDAGRLPHHSVQGDVLLGQNAYFVKAGVRGRHAVIEDTCVSCHMNKTKPPAALSNNFGGTNHTFLASASICNECHTDVDGENLAAGFEDMLLTLEDAIGDRIAKVMRDQIAAGNSIKVGSTMVTSLADVKILAGRNQQVIVTLTNGKPLSATNLTDLRVVKKDGTAVTFLAVSGNDIPKAFWNWALLTYDASKGAHNPSWTLDVISESLTAMGATYKGASPVTASDLVVGMR